MHWQILTGDVREQLQTLPAASVQTCVTSPPYWGLRDYGHAGQLGLESTPDAYVAALVAVFADVRRVLKGDGTLWLNLGDSYAGSWGAQSRGNTTGEAKSNLEGSSMLSARQIVAHPPGQTETGPLKRTPGLKAKDLVGIPWMVAFALRADGWYLRSDIIWSKPNPMPESTQDRPTKAHEYVFLLSKSARYFYNAAAIREPYAESTIRGAETGYTGTARKDYAAGGAQDPSETKRRATESVRRRVGMTDASKPAAGAGANKRSVWTVPTRPYAGAHFATYPEKLIEPCILAGSREGDIVLDTFTGSGTTGAVAIRHQRNFVGCELNPAYVELARTRIGAVAPMFAAEGAWPLHTKGKAA